MAIYGNAIFLIWSEQTWQTSYLFQWKYIVKIIWVIYSYIGSYLVSFENHLSFPQYSHHFSRAHLRALADAANINQALHSKRCAAQTSSEVSLSFQFRLPSDVSHMQQKWQRL